MGKSASFPNGINDLCFELVLHVPMEESRCYPNKISTLDAELVLRHVPGKSR